MFCRGDKMDFTYKWYRELIKKIQKNGYCITDYHDYRNYKKTVILRHDVDNDLEKAEQLARIEYESDVKSTYFVLLTSDFYNPMSKKSIKSLKKILKYGHEIGLHFDEVQYDLSEENWDENYICECIKHEAKVLSDIMDDEVLTVSMHRPSKKTLSSDLLIPGMINSYGTEFFRNFKYVSDSRMNWRENVEKIVDSNQYERIHILTHAFWYFENEKDINTILKEYVLRAKYDRYEALKNDITDLYSVLKFEDVE